MEHPLLRWRTRECLGQAPWRCCPDEASGATGGLRATCGLYLGDGLMVFLFGLGLSVKVGDGFFGEPFFVCAYVFGFGLDVLGRFGWVVLFVFLFLEIFSAPGIFAQRSFAHGAGIDDHAGFDGGLEIDAAEIGGGGLQGVEQEAGGFGVQCPLRMRRMTCMSETWTASASSSTGRSSATRARRARLALRTMRVSCQRLWKKQKWLRFRAGDPHWVPLILRCSQRAMLAG
jgi:hypothetical protein